MPASTSTESAKQHITEMNTNLDQLQSIPVKEADSNTGRGFLRGSALVALVVGVSVLAVAAVLIPILVNLLKTSSSSNCILHSY